MTPDQEHKLGNRAAVLIIVTLCALCALCALASLSGCLTAAKIGEWQRAVYGWGMDPGASKPCQITSADASAYLAKANQRLAEAGKLTDLASDSRAKQLVTSAALACGKEAPLRSERLCCGYSASPLPPDRSNSAVLPTSQKISRKSY